ncbi:HEPN domain-containing protein [Shewanella algae]|uniref:HEPN domain-containing protein n=1 Tax=Shewanella algae TaxID=38313 RepID=UPI001C573C84|nr:HEPN domain-containing protein [Shewanella algae]
MKFRSLRKWDDIENSKGLILFAQMVDELLFEFTLNTYKPSAMNTSLLIREAIQTHKAVEAGTIQKPNLGHILNELCENLDKDIVAQSLLFVDVKGIKATLKDPKSSGSSILTCIKLLENQIPLNRYKNKNEELLIECICGDQNPSKIRGFTRSYITTLLNSGYSEKYIQKLSRSYFHYSDDRISGNSAIKDYLELFNKEVQEYFVIYRAPGYFKHFIKGAAKIGITVTDEVADFGNAIDRFNFKLKQNEIYMLAKCKAKEPHAAKKYADIKIDQLQTLIGLYHHKEAPKPILDGLVVFPDKENGKKISSHFNPMHKCRDLEAGVAARRLEMFMDGFSMERESFYRFNRSAELHALALGSDSVENQLINLWIALESLIPNKDDDKISQIEHISKSIMPFLNLNYIQKIATRLSKDLLLWNKGKTKEILRQVDGNGVMEKTCHLLALDKYEQLRGELANSFGDFHLLHERYKYLEFLFSSPANFVTALDAHTQRVDWQIRRIYRARNMIVHDGVTPSYVEILIENTHDYLDSIFSSLMTLASQEYVLNSIDQGFKMVEISFSSYLKSLNKKGISFTEGNIDQLLFKHRV